MVISWNINGKGLAKTRDQVVKATLQKIAGSMDIVCIQENTFSYGGKRFSDRFPTTVNQMECVEQREENPVYNLVLYNEEKFEIIQDGPGTAATYIEKAYKLMNIEKDIMDWIHEGGDDRKTKFYTNPGDCTDDIMEHLTRKGVGDGGYKPHIPGIIVDIYKQMQMYKPKYMGNATQKVTLAFEDCRNHFIRHGEYATKEAEEMVGKRAAMVLLNHKDTDTTLLVISFHSYNPSLCPDRLNYLLLDFVEKIYWVTDTITVLICGDFNKDIKKSKDVTVQELLKGYTCEEYALTELRRSVPRIDYILLRKPEHSNHSLTKVEAENIVMEGSIEDQKKVTNHSPLVTTLKIQQASWAYRL